MSRTLKLYLISIRPCLGQWHRYSITCKTTPGMLALYELSELSEYPY
ncbi:hypothetical protein F383_32758 [Gossypium arboreum]|uniref:Uncharacterized protein n=1 Tax=Gossypium arboreum TaxID=29729 RepID=A0A0B0N1G1_GOSAR|nr:hypothetical protein F383_32758 [Gossypium arboreum]